MQRGLTLGRNLQLLADRWKERTVMVTGKGERCTYGQFNDRVNALAWSLRERGIVRDDAVGLLLPNAIAFNVAYFAPQKLGAVTVPVNYRNSPREVTHILDRAGVDILIADIAYEELATRSTAELTGIDVITVGDGTFETLLENDTAEPPAVAHGDEVAYIAHTSGSTGVPKLIPHTHDDAIMGGIQGVHELEARRDDRGLCLSPLFHTAGLYTFLIPFMFMGGTTILLREFDPAEALSLMEAEAATAIFGVPAQYRAMLQVEDLEAYDLSSLRQARTGASPMIRDTIERVKETFSENFYNVYGLTECQQNVVVNTPQDPDEKEESIGKATYFWEVRVVEPAEPADLDTEAEVSRPGTGLLLAKGPSAMEGYLGQPEQTVESLHDGWVNTGDIAEIDADGYLYVIDRMDNMLVSGGENVYPQEVERVLDSHPSVVECGVFGTDDERWGTQVSAAVVLAADITTERLDQYLRDSAELADFKRPREYVVTDEIPRGPSGSIRRDALRSLGT
jgi:acyl-CoA synthetase (AMP-forming)/AMP-acid ligase II